MTIDGRKIDEMDIRVTRSKTFMLRFYFDILNGCESKPPVAAEKNCARFYFEASHRIPSPPVLFTYRYRAVPATLSLTPSSVMDASVRAAVLLLLLLGLSWSSCSPTSGCRLRIPPHDQVARVARFVAHQCDWASMATISTHKPVVGQPFSNAFSVSDGPEGAGSGVPYMYLTRMEISVQDLEVRSQNSTSCLLALNLMIRSNSVSLNVCSLL